jgi:muramoyltetrapeptide carboxypeptidase
MSSAKIRPEYLKSGDEVAMISPAFAIDESKVMEAVKFLEGWGLKIRLGRNVFGKEGPFAGTEEERLSDLRIMTSDKKIKAIFFSRGGYGMLKIIDKVDFSVLRRHPKWYIGFSDITVLHLWLNKIHNIASVHGEMPLNYSNAEKSTETFTSLHGALFGDLQDIEWKGDFIRPGNAEGEVTGGNLSLIYSLIGTPAEPETKGRILFIEDVGEYYYHLDRMLTSLKLSGKLKDLSALVVGGMNKMEETSLPWGKSPEQIISAIVSEYSYPVFFNFPAGHINDNRAFYIGMKAKISLDGGKAVLKYR